MADRDFDYAAHLRLDELLSLQQGQETGHPDELHFVVTHQAIELWFKVMIHDLRRARSHIDRSEWSCALTAIARVEAVLTVVIAQMATLTDLGPVAFLGFRHRLGSASGLQSVQFRVVEVLSGLRDPEYLRTMRGIHGQDLRGQLSAALAEPSLADSVQAAADRGGVGDWADVYRHPERHGVLLALAQALLDYDTLWVRWRTDHILLKERIIGGSAHGTAGTSHAYLERTLRLRFFPFLWEIPQALAAANGRVAR